MKNFLLHDAEIWDEPPVQLTGLDFELLDTDCEFYEKHLFIRIMEAGFKWLWPNLLLMVWRFFFVRISLNICLRFILTINGILFSLNLCNILSSPSTHTHTHTQREKKRVLFQSLKMSKSYILHCKCYHYSLYLKRKFPVIFHFWNQIHSHGKEEIVEMVATGILNEPLVELTGLDF